MNKFPFQPILIVAALNLFLLFSLFLLYCSLFANPSGFEIRLPRAVVSESLQEDQVILITAENVLYLNNKVVTFNELKKELSKIGKVPQNIIIRMDRRSSAGRVMDVWDLCRALGNSRVQILAGQEN